jgi:lysophospholipase L1-like esterase
MRTLHVLGDSISMHYGPYLEKYVRSYCDYSRKEAKIGVLDNPEGQNGCDSTTVLSYLVKCMDQSKHWDFILLNCGLHDIRWKDGKHQTNNQLYQKNLFEILQIANNISDHIIWVRTTPVNDNLHNSLRQDIKRYDSDVVKYNEIADRIMIDHGIYKIDLYTFCKCLGGAETYKDHIHFNEESRNLQGAFIAGNLISYFNKL